ncbi:MAG: hypothetical protein NT034_01870 [Candidatus Magasanikbacteria bacterium]|nr:hypothetical protein [Candidatus Magasanikbacteria bacterium]
MIKKINIFLLVTLSIFSLLFAVPFASAKTIVAPAKKTQTTKKVVVAKKVTKKVVKPVKNVAAKTTATKNIPMSQLPNPNAAGSSAMKTYLQTINDARLTFKKEQAQAKTKEAKATAEEKYSQAVQDAMSLLNESKTPPAPTESATTIE